jgi:hypothetical protein
MAATYTWSGIWVSGRNRWLCVGDFYVGILPDSLKNCPLAFPSHEQASSTIPLASKAIGIDEARLVAKKLKNGMTPERIEKLKKQRIAKLVGRVYCPVCKKRLRRTGKSGELIFVDGKAFKDGEQVSVLFCSDRCRERFAAHIERDEECLDQELRALRHGKVLLKAMASYTKAMMDREASQSRRRESEPAISLQS